MNKHFLKPIVIAAMLCTGAVQAQSGSSNNGGLRGMQGLRAQQFNNGNQLGANTQMGARRAERGGLRLGVGLGQLRLGVTADRTRGDRGFNGSGASLPGLAAAERFANRTDNNNVRPIDRMLAAQNEREANRDSNESSDDDDNGFLGLENSSTLGTDDEDSSGRDDGDSGFLGIGDSSTLGTDDGPSGRDTEDNGFLGINNSSTLGTDDDNGSPGDPDDGGFLGFGDSSTLGTD